MVRARIEVKDVNPDTDSFYEDLNFYSSILECVVLPILLILLVYIGYKIYRPKRLLNNLPIYFGTIGPTLPEKDKIKNVPNPPYAPTTQ